MTLLDWIFSRYPGDTTINQWGLIQILTMIGVIITIIVISLLFRKRSQKAKRIVLWILVGLIIIFEMARRSINLIKCEDLTNMHDMLHILLPRPMCAIACWSLILTMIINKKFLYNFSSIIALICAIIFFSYPSVGFREPYFLFEDLYSVATHSLLLITSISFITLGMTDYLYSSFWKVAVYYLFVIAYAFVEMNVLRIEDDPMYIMPNNDIEDILGINHTLYLVFYVCFMVFYFNIFYIFSLLKNRKHTEDNVTPTIVYKKLPR